MEVARTLRVGTAAVSIPSELAEELVRLAEDAFTGRLSLDYKDGQIMQIVTERRRRVRTT